MISIIDYGVGNLFSLKCSLDRIGAECVVTDSKEQIYSSDKIILPGVGAFKDAMEKLKTKGLDKVLIECAKEGTPLLGICLGMQMLFEESSEFGICKGLALIPGKVKELKGYVPQNLDIPHMGWNALHITQKEGIMKSTSESECVYFVHSYAAFTEEKYITSTAEYGKPVTASVQNKNVYGTQFHPEKSGETGLKILKEFTTL